MPLSMSYHLVCRVKGQRLKASEVLPGGGDGVALIFIEWIGMHMYSLSKLYHLASRDL